MKARMRDDGRQGTFGFLVRDVAEGEGFEAGHLRGVVQRIDRTGAGPRFAVSLEVTGLPTPIRLDFRPDDLAVSYADEVLGFALRGPASLKMRVKAPRERKIRRVDRESTPSFPALAD